MAKIGLKMSPFQEVEKGEKLYLHFRDSIISLIREHRGRKVYFYFFKRPEHYNQEMLSHFFHLFTIATYGRNCFDIPYQVEHFGIYNQYSRDGILHFYKLTMNWISTL